MASDPGIAVSIVGASQRCSSLFADIARASYAVHQIAPAQMTGTFPVIPRDSAVVILNLDGISLDHQQLLEHIASAAPSSQVLVLTPSNSATPLVSQLEDDQVWHTPATTSNEDLLFLIAQGCILSEMRRADMRLHTSSPGKMLHIGLVAQSPAMQDVVRQLTRLARVDSSLLIGGETGTGKTTIAKLLHQMSPRREAPFIMVSCGALPQDLIDSELFGHEKGAFTGASQSRIGSIELADKGTLFLDEIGEIPLALQPKLLHFLQERTIKSIGGTRFREVDVRIIAATNKNLAQMVRDGQFREDLFYRLNVVSLQIPPLRERREDLAPIAHSYLRYLSHKRSGASFTLSQEAISALYAYPWPGNIRELQNVIERATVHCSSPLLRAEDLRFDSTMQTSATINSISIPLNATLEEIEKIALRERLVTYEGNMSRTAESLGISLKSLYNKVARYGIVRAHLKGTRTTRAE